MVAKETAAVQDRTSETGVCSEDEFYDLAVARLRAIKTGEDTTRSIEDVMRDYGMEV
jgi:hypothetical protein